MWNNQNLKPPSGYVRPWLTDEEFNRLQAYVDDERRTQLSDEEIKKKCGASARYEKPCPEPIPMCKPKDKEPEFICPGEKKGARIPECSAPKPYARPPKCPVYKEAPCEEELLGPAILYKKEEDMKKKKNSGAYSCIPDDDEPCF